MEFPLLYLDEKKRTHWEAIEIALTSRPHLCSQLESHVFVKASILAQPKRTISWKIYCRHHLAFCSTQEVEEKQIRGVAWMEVRTCFRGSVEELLFVLRCGLFKGILCYYVYSSWQEGGQCNAIVYMCVVFVEFMCRWNKLITGIGQQCNPGNPLIHTIKKRSILTR